MQLQRLTNWIKEKRVVIIVSSVSVGIILAYYGLSNDNLGGVIGIYIRMPKEISKLEKDVDRIASKLDVLEVGYTELRTEYRMLVNKRDYSRVNEPSYPLISEDNMFTVYSAYISSDKARKEVQKINCKPEMAKNVCTINSNRTYISAKLRNDKPLLQMYDGVYKAVVHGERVVVEFINYTTGEKDWCFVTGIFNWSINDEPSPGAPRMFNITEAMVDKLKLNKEQGVFLLSAHLIPNWEKDPHITKFVEDNCGMLR